MANTKTLLAGELFTPFENSIAKIVVEDMIYNAFTDPQLHGDKTIELCLELLLNNAAETMIQGIVAQYVGSEKDAVMLGVQATIDPRLKEYSTQSLSYSYAGLQQAMINQLELYFSCPLEMRKLLSEKIISSRRQIKSKITSFLE